MSRFGTSRLQERAGRSVGLLHDVADAVKSLDYGSAPGAVHAYTKQHLLDTLGCGYFATRLPLAAAVHATFCSQRVVVGRVPVFGTAAGASPTDGAFANGTLASAFELDSGGSYVHPGPCILGSAISSCHAAGRAVSGRDLMVAMLAGYEVTVRVSECIGLAPEHEPGWHTPAYHGAIGAAATASRILELDASETAHALALAADMAGGGLIHARNDAKRIHTGRAAQTGIVAALLATTGVEGGLDVLEHSRWGYARALSYGCETAVDSESLLADMASDLFRDWRAYARLAFKYYPFHSIGQSVIDNVTALRREHAVTLEDVERVRVGVTSFVYEHETMLLPATQLAATNFSIPFATALALARDVPRLTQSDVDAGVYLDGLADPRVVRAQGVVKCVVSSVLDEENPYSFDSVVEIETRAGSNLSRRTHYGLRARKHGAGAIAFDEVSSRDVETKFRNLSRGVIPRNTADAIVERVESLEDVENVVTQLFDVSLLSPGHEEVA